MTSRLRQPPGVAGSLPRLGYLTGEFPRATDTFIQREVAALRATGFEVHTFSVRRPEARTQSTTDRRRSEATTTYLLESARGLGLFRAHAEALLLGPRRYFQAIELAWATKRPGIRGTIYQLFYFLEAVVLARELLRRRIDHVHNHFADSSCTVAMLAAAVSALPFSFTLHGSGIFFEARSWHLDRKLDRAAFCACISHFTRSQAAVFAHPETAARLHVVHCGVDPDLLRPVRHRGRGTRLVFVGRVIEQKGLRVLFEAMTILDEAVAPITLTIVGDGPDRPALERRAVEMGLDSRVRFVGLCSQAEVMAHLAEADIFVLPSYAEGVPVVAMEALGSAIPVVATQVGGIAELVEDGVNGYVVRPGDATQLADRISRLIECPELRNRFGRAGRDRVLEEFDASVEARRLATLFIDCAAGRQSPVRPLPVRSNVGESSRATG